jgi:hypothetical protein
MSENPYDPAVTPPAPESPPSGAASVQPQYGATVMPPGQGPIGEIRPTGMTIFLFIITLSIYSWFWYYKTFEEMKRHKGDGLGGAVALVLLVVNIFVGVVGLILPFLSSSEVGQMYERRGQHKPVSGMTGLWFFPGIFILVGPIIWFVKTNRALNDYWASLGATK